MPVLTRSASSSLKTTDIDAYCFYQTAIFAKKILWTIYGDKFSRDFYVCQRAGEIIYVSECCSEMADSLVKYLKTSKLDELVSEYKTKSAKDISQIAMNTYRTQHNKLNKLICEVRLYRRCGKRPSFITRDEEWNC
jgi:hypothetical protein